MTLCLNIHSDGPVWPIPEWSVSGWTNEVGARPFHYQPSVSRPSDIHITDTITVGMSQYFKFYRGELKYVLQHLREDLDRAIDLAPPYMRAPLRHCLFGSHPFGRRPGFFESSFHHVLSGDETVYWGYTWGNSVAKTFLQSLLIAELFTALVCPTRALELELTHPQWYETVKVVRSSGNTVTQARRRRGVIEADTSSHIKWSNHAVLPYYDFFDALKLRWTVHRCTPWINALCQRTALDAVGLIVTLVTGIPWPQFQKMAHHLRLVAAPPRRSPRKRRSRA